MFPETYVTDRDVSKVRRAIRHGKRYDMPVKRFPVVRKPTNE